MNITELLKNTAANINFTVTANDLEQFAEEIVKKTIEQTKQEHREKLIPRKKVCEFIKSDTLTKWKNKGFLIPVYIGTKSFYKQSDLEAINIHIEQ